MLIITIWWFISARKWFKGPKVNIEHLMLGREGNVVDGEGKDRDSGSDLPEAQGGQGHGQGQGLQQVRSTDKPPEVN